MHFVFATKLNNKLIFDKDDLFHLIKVKRIKVGEKLKISDQQNTYLAIVKSTEPFEIETLETSKIVSSNKYIHCYVPVLERTPFEWMIEKLTELGVNEYTPVQFKFTNFANLNYDRLQKIIKSACVQSNQPMLPKLNKLVKFNDISFEKLHNICVADFANHDTSINCDQNNYNLVIGPEGGFSNEERQILGKYRTLNLGNSILRSETAAIVITTLIKVYG